MYKESCPDDLEEIVQVDPALGDQKQLVLQRQFGDGAAARQRAHALDARGGPRRHQHKQDRFPYVHLQV